MDLKLEGDESVELFNTMIIKDKPSKVYDKEDWLFILDH
jgi:hypothetical protein